jgi:hypothetical protein
MGAKGMGGQITRVYTDYSFDHNKSIPWGKFCVTSKVKCEWITLSQDKCNKFNILLNKKQRCINCVKFRNEHKKFYFKQPPIKYDKYSRRKEWRLQLRNLNRLVNASKLSEGNYAKSI